MKKHICPDCFKICRSTKCFEHHKKTRKSKGVELPSEEHVVNFAVGQYSDGTEFVFKGYDALHEFGEFLFAMNHKGFAAIAHNAKGFDTVLIQRWL